MLTDDIAKERWRLRKLRRHPDLRHMVIEKQIAGRLLADGVSLVLNCARLLSTGNLSLYLASAVERSQLSSLSA
ncbi:hypothetical protein Rhsp01_40140 [Rhizobium sp. NBRC 114257]|uniref:Uncharacterized protein n=1 Tax=Rhizobium dioscoreae TaxID=2653122 RepID=A0ABQ0Z742_9HYPH|nr:hypothetical protein RsS93_40000 [Rhizobium dioscoreae]GLU82838.1 hypothetical protein Rhsp01_40140 [Rhizobium sp. NBRC 114257]